MTSTVSLDVAALVRAIEARDAEAQLRAYSSDAELTVVDENNPPSAPLVVQGADQLRIHFTDVTERDMTHEVRTAVATDDHIALEVACRYPDGTRVLCMCVGAIADGQIAWARQVQSWDH